MKCRGPILADARVGLRAFVLVCALATAACGRGAAPAIEREGDVFRATGWSGPAPAGGWGDVFALHAGADDAPAVMGDYELKGGVLSFTPRFAPSDAVTLTATYDPPGDGPDLVKVFPGVEKAVTPSARVVAIYPSADEWPANTLRMYVEFSAPMARGEAWTHLRVLDEKGQPIEKPFVEIDQELWDPEGRRLTVLFDPGRLKRGLIDNETSGPPLVDGRTVTLEADPAWRDAAGAPLVEGFRRTIRVGTELRTVIDPKAWKVEAPASASADLVVVFPRPLDQALARRAIGVRLAGEPVDGKVALEANETRWRFTPASLWKPGRYALVIDGIVEDIAGNRMGKLFDVDTSDPTQSTRATPRAEIAFEVGGRSCSPPLLSVRPSDYG